MIGNTMFIRQKLKTNGKISVQIVESIRKGNKVTQKIIEHVGLSHADDTAMLEGLIRLAEDKIKRFEQAKQHQTALFGDIMPSKPGRKKKKELKDILPTSEVCLEDIKEEKRIIEGVDDIAGQAYDELGYDKLLSRGSSKLLKDLVITRLVFPYSKHKLWQILFEQFDKEYSLSNIYRVLDQLHLKIDRMKQLTCGRTQALMPRADVVLFDVTTLHFESVDTDELREFGYSKNFRFNTTQVVLALATNDKGLPIGYELFSGDKAEVKTLIESIKKWKGLFNISSVCFIGDRAMFSKDNLALLEANNYHYVIAAKLRKLPKLVQEDILDEKNYRLGVVNKSTAWIGEFNLDGKRLITSYSTNRAKNDQKKRKQIIEAIKPKTGTASKLIKNGAKKYIKVEQGTTSLDALKIAQDEMWDGMHGVITNVTTATAFELLDKYHSLWHIEEAFRINKHNLKMRPIYHWTPKRIEAHVALCYMAFAVLKLIQYKVELTQIRYSVQDVLDVMVSVQASIHVHKITKDKYRIPGGMSHNASCLYKAFNLERSLDASIYMS